MTLREMRDGASLTQDDLSALVGKSKRTIASWESGATRPSIDVLESLAQAFGVEIIEVVAASNESVEQRKEAASE